MDEIKINNYRKLSITSLITGILAVIFCLLYFILWTFFDNFLTSFIVAHKFMSYVMILYVCIGVVLTITSVGTGSIDLSRIKTGIHDKKGKNLDIIGISLGSLLILFGFTLWFVDFFGFIDIIS